MKKLPHLSLCLIIGALLTSCEQEPPEPEVSEESDATAKAETSDHHTIELTSSNFEKVVLNADKPVLVDFWAPWCGPCLELAPTVEEVAKEYEGRAVVAKLDVDSEKELADKYEINAIPNLKVFVDGKVVQEMVGTVAKSRITGALDANL